MTSYEQLQEVDLTAVLAGKEQKAALRQQLLLLHGLPVFSVALNIPGPVKTSPQICDLLRFAIDRFRAAAVANDVMLVTEHFYYPVTGPYAFLVATGDATELKRLAILLESTDEVARLFDIDVFAATGEQISRDSLGLGPRCCFVCGEPAIACMRSEAHSQAQIRDEVSRRLCLFAAQRTQPWDNRVWSLAGLATRAMLLEAACTPSPGLVDMVNAGAHDDMDFFTFLQSSAALAGTMLRCAAAGWEHQGEAADLLPVLRQIGLSGESEMFAATGGVNTQKGLLFLLGVLVAAAGLNLRQPQSDNEAGICRQVATISLGIVERELAPLLSKKQIAQCTAGERLYIEHGIVGIRGEMEAGLPSVQKMGLPCLREAQAAGLTLNDSLVHALVGLMTTVEDTTIVNRHGIAVLRDVQEQAAKIMTAGGMLSSAGRSQIDEMDTIFIRRNISPGGAADMLAATYFIANAP